MLFTQDEETEMQVDLLETDGVPGAILEMQKLNDYVVYQLRRWLACRQLRTVGNKSELITR